MRVWLHAFCSGLLALSLLVPAHSSGQTPGTAKFEATIYNYTSNPAHWTVGWITGGNNSFIKTFRKQGPSSWTTTHWSSHCVTWWNAKGGATGSTAFDGYTSATATTYTGTNCPVVWVWNCKDQNNNMVADGSYKFWLQYAENSGQGPHTTNGLLWVKGPAPSTNTYPDRTYIKNMKVTWIPTPAPKITQAKVVNGNLILNGTGLASTTYYVINSADPALPVANWTKIYTNVFSAAGTCTYVTATAPGNRFYRLVSP